MTIELQKLIGYSYVELEKAKKMSVYNDGRNEWRQEFYNGKVQAFSDIIDAAELLLNAETQTTVKTKQHDGNASVS